MRDYSYSTEKRVLFRSRALSSVQLRIPNTGGGPPPTAWIRSNGVAGSMSYRVAASGGWTKGGGYLIGQL